jgi:hypothetical protein
VGTKLVFDQMAVPRVVLPSGQKLTLCPDCSTTPGNYGWSFVALSDQKPLQITDDAKKRKLLNV